MKHGGYAGLIITTHVLDEMMTSACGRFAAVLMCRVCGGAPGCSSFKYCNMVDDMKLVCSRSSRYGAELSSCGGTC